MRPYALSFEVFPDRYEEARGALYASGERMLSVPEITSIRRNHHPLDPSPDNPWAIPFATSSRECVGLSPAGNEVVAVYHPRAGQTDPDWKGMDRPAFWKLLEGGFGDLTVVDLRRVRRRYRDARPLWPVLVARLGGEDLACEVVKQLERQTGSSAGRALIAGGFREIGLSSSGVVTRMLMAYPLQESGVSGGRPTYVLPVDQPTPDWNGHHRLCMAIHRQDEKTTAIAPPLTRKQMMADSDKAGWREGGGVADRPIRLRMFDGKLMTDSAGMSAHRPVMFQTPGWPEHEVTSFEEIGEHVSLPGQFLSRREISEMTPSGANAFRAIVGPFGEIDLAFGRAVVDTSRRMPSEDKFKHDHAYRRATTETYAEKWWRERQRKAGGISP